MPVVKSTVTPLTAWSEVRFLPHRAQARCRSSVVEQAGPKGRYSLDCSPATYPFQLSSWPALAKASVGQVRTQVRRSLGDDGPTVRLQPACRPPINSQA
jgi:hypothetical protein